MLKKVEDLILIKFLGKGTFGEVYLSQNINSNKYFATKMMNKKSIADSPKLQKYLVNEINILKMLDHPNIVSLEEVKEDDNFVYIVMEYIDGGELSECLKKYIDKYGKAFSEEIVQHLMRQILDALVCIHDHKIIHRDLKRANIMVYFDSQADKDNLNMMKAKIKIIDFGCSILLTEQDLASTIVGSPINMDPIILEQNRNKLMDNNITYDTKVDIWSLGTVCYELLMGKTVFNAKTTGELVDKVKDGNYKVPSTISKELIDFLNRMLQYDANNRSTARELQNHPFITKNFEYFTHINFDKNQIQCHNNYSNNNNQQYIKKDYPGANNNPKYPYPFYRQPMIPNSQRPQMFNYGAQRPFANNTPQYPYPFYKQPMAPNSQRPQMFNYGAQRPFAYNTPQYPYPQTPYRNNPYPYYGYNLQNQYQKRPNIGMNNNYPYMYGKGNNNQFKRGPTNYRGYRNYK